MQLSLLLFFTFLVFPLHWREVHQKVFVPEMSKNDGQMKRQNERARNQCILRRKPSSSKNRKLINPVYTSFPDFHMNFSLAQLQALSIYSICLWYVPMAPQAFVLLFFVLGDLTSMMNVKCSKFPEHAPHVPATRPVLTLLAQGCLLPACQNWDA